jgi:hypothetical protein
MNAPSNRVSNTQRKRKASARRLAVKIAAGLFTDKNGRVGNRMYLVDDYAGGLVMATCPDCSGEGEAPKSLLGACLECPTCGGTGRVAGSPGAHRPPDADVCPECNGSGKGGVQGADQSGKGWHKWS